MATPITITEQDTRVDYEVGSTADDTFDIPFEFFETSDIRVSVGGVEKTSGFTVTGNAVQGGFSDGTLTLDTAVSDTTVSIWRDIPLSRTTVFPTSGGFSIVALNTQLARIVAMIQQENQEFLRAVRKPVGEAGSLGDLPSASTRAEKYLGFDADGNPVALGASSDVQAILAEGDANTRTLARRFADMKLDSVAELVGLSTTDIPDQTPVRVLGFYSAFDHGGGGFVWNATKDKSNHDGGFTIDPDHSSAPGASGWWASENTGGGVWERITAPYKSATAIVADFGTKPHDSSFDNAPAINAAVGYLKANLGGELHWPGGYSTHVAGTIELDAPGLALVGAGKDTSAIYATDPASLPIVRKTARGCRLDHILVYCNQFTTNSFHYLVLYGTGAVGCEMSFANLQGGYYTFGLVGSNITDCRFIGCSFTKSTGRAIIYSELSGSGLVGANRFYGCISNQAYPNGGASASNYGGAWTSGESISAGDIREVQSGAYYLQAVQGGTTGSTEPAPTFYDTEIADNDVRWQLMGSTAYRSVFLGSGVLLFTFFDHDATGPFQSAYEVQNLSSAAEPWGHDFISCESSGPITNGFNIAAGRECTITDPYLEGPTGPGTTHGVLIQGNASQCSVNRPRIYGFGVGVSLGGGHSACEGGVNGGNGISAAVSASWCSVTNGKHGQNADRGNNGIGVKLESGAQFCTVTGNDVEGITSPIDDSSGQTNNVIAGNPGFVTRNQGQVTFTTGTVSRTFSHGLDAQPSAIIVTPASDPQNRYWVSGVTATDFTITLSSGPASDVGFYFRATAKNA